jgi:hypothetical protein
MKAFADEALRELDPPVRAEVERARELIADADTPEGQAFHAADVVDRVIEIAGRLAAAAPTCCSPPKGSAATWTTTSRSQP